MMTRIDETIDKLRRLRLLNMADHLAEAIDKEKEHNYGFLWLLDYLIETEMESRRIRAIENRHRQSKLIDKFLPSDFEFKFHASRLQHRSVLLRLLECDFIGNFKTFGQSFQ